MKLFGLNLGRKAPPAPPQRKGFVAIGGVGTHTPVTPENVTERPWENGAVLAGVRWLSRTFAEAPIVVERLSEDGVWEVQPDHPAARILENPNPYYPGRLLWSGVLLSMLVSGTAYILKARDGNNKLRELHYASHTDVRPQQGGDFIASFIHTPHGRKEKPYAPTDVVYIRESIDPHNPILAISPTSAIGRELRTDTEASRYTHRTLTNSGTALAISLKQADLAFDNDAADLIVRKVTNATTGETRGEPIVFSDPIEVHPIGQNPEQLALKELTSGAEQRICGVLGIHPMILGLAAGNDARTYSNMAEAREATYESYIVPMQALICDFLNRQLLPEFAAEGEVLRYRFDLAAVRILQEDTEKLHGRLREAYKLQIIDRAEFRAGVGLVVRPEDEGIYYDPTGQSAPTPEVAVAAKRRLQKRLKAMAEQAAKVPTYEVA